MYKIGEFAAMNNITVRALHHYEEIGLLKPAETDRYTGYRYYSEEQSSDIRIINLLKELGFSLSDISDLMDLSIEKDLLIRRLNEKYTQARLDLGRAQYRSRGIENLMELVESMPDRRKIYLKEIDKMAIFNGKKVIDHGKSFDWGFEDVFEKAKKDNYNIAMMVMDIDRFKSVNDTYGRKAGDAVLDAIFRLTINELPGGEGKIGGYKSNLERVGGDEFIIRVDISKEESLKLAERIRKAVAENDFGYLGIKEKITMTIGVANMDSGPKDSHEFKHLAESALYLAKHNGRNRVEEYSEDLKEKLNTDQSSQG
jgi:diguanylate cyclase (GGDEF)-like protein